MDVNDSRIADHLDWIDSAADWQPEPVLDWPNLPRMDLTAYTTWGKAYGRGLVTAAELSRYHRLVDGHPASWKGWLNERGMWRMK